jgi:hypothetical protein
MTSSDVSPRESQQLAVASATLGPWRTAGAVGLVAGAAAVGIDLITLHWSLSILAGPASLALCLFFLIGGIGSVVANKGGDRRLRRWAAEHQHHHPVLPEQLGCLREHLDRPVARRDRRRGHRCRRLRGREPPQPQEPVTPDREIPTGSRQRAPVLT